ncbi:MAG: hypothetical protein AAF611_14820 [Bacteroidota bacterium]
MKKLLSLCVVLLSFVLSAHAQERYKVEYDYLKDTITYNRIKEDGTLEALKKPRIKRNSMVEIRLKNVNPFALKVTPAITSENVFVEGNSYTINSLFGSLKSNTANPNNLNFNITAPQFSDAPDAAVTETVIRAEGKAAAQNIAKEIKSTNTLSKKILTAKDVFIANLTNPNLTKDKIKEKLENILKDVVDSDNTVEDDYYAFLNDIRDALNKKNNIIKSNVATATRLFRRDINDPTKLSEENLLEANAVVTETERSINTSLANVETLQQLYAMLEASSFEQVTDYEAEKDKTTIELTFKKSDFLKEMGIQGTDETVKSRSFKLMASGGLKINTSIALTLNNFGDNSSDFYVDSDNVIGADKNDFFVPSLATMINFYPFAGEKINFGGSFGVSIPITDDITGVNFLLGPTIFFGSKNRLSFTGGIAYGPVERLRDGLTVGEETQRASNDITRNVYDFGYFFGISFSLFDVKN